MSQSFSLRDSLAALDLQTYLSRAARVEEGSARLIAGSGVLAVYTASLYPRGLLDQTPTVLGLRTFVTAPEVAFDAVVPIRSLLDRVARVGEAADAAGADGTAEPIEIRLPLEVSTVTWAGISPPRGGWRKVGETSAALLTETARAGIAEVADALPPGTGESLVQRVRAEVWGREIEGLEYVPAGAAFAAESLGFLAVDQEVSILETGPWTRLSTKRGHTLVRRQAWTLRL
ncbi:hypothetical protein O159_15490 [Leifsonia xyli subsp. cynodontis DSM 46306]|jgi:hypothetical protein|uniref:Uncharacterized protein n=1 Tax=Leifsonia xyli subsp. cynodontis DSM 46306 TaxID=1389489 RepID=U3P5L3_LEIXC|nr:hypothetical protein [Leifsonia xyli]AGW41600.1 hypothetical protein O159_15490 [Leifsonia xyli subsp. cynodontis DSM 46306]